MVTAFAEHACALHWHPEDHVTVLWAYFDESGHPADPQVPVFGIGGLRATCETWLSFSERWRAALDAEGIKTFHMKEVYSGHHEPYRGWSDEKKTEFLLGLVDVVGLVRPPLGGIQALPEDISQRDRIDEAYRQAYHHAIRSALNQIGATRKIHFVFALHEEISPQDLTRYHGWVRDGYAQALSDDRVGTITFGRPRDLEALQAADLVAWEMSRHHRNPSVVRPAMKRLLDMNPIIYV